MFMTFMQFFFVQINLFKDLIDNLRECHVLDFNELCAFDDFDLNNKKKKFHYSVSKWEDSSCLCNLLHLCFVVLFCMTSLIALCKNIQCIERQAAMDLRQFWWEDCGDDKICASFTAQC